MKLINTMCRSIVLLTFAAIVGHASSAVVGSGYFAGNELVPMQGTRMTQLDAEPAAVLIFGADAQSVDVTARFDGWYRSASRPAVNVYAVSVGQSELPFDVIAEVLHQRNLAVPVFHTRSDLLKGEPYRLVLLDNGGQERRSFSTLDLTALEDELLGRVPVAPAGTLQPTLIGTSGEPQQVVTTASVSIDGGPAVTPTPPPVETTIEESGAPVYRNTRFSLMVEFPPSWPYRIAKSGDGAVAKSPRGGKLDLRVWALPNDTTAVGGPGKMSATQYIEQSLAAIGEANRTQVKVERRLGVDDDGIDGRDVIYSYRKLTDPANPAAGSIRYRGRMQVFDANGNFKAVGAEGPSAEYDGNQPTVEPFFLSFRPKIVVEKEEPASAVPVPSSDEPPPQPVGLPGNRLF